MFEIKVNDGNPAKVVKEGSNYSVDGLPFHGEIERSGKDSFLVRKDGVTTKVHVVSIDQESKTMVLKVNGKRTQVALRSEIDSLLERLGIHAGKTSKAGAIKAPMPGMIHSILVTEGQKVTKGEPVLILEAMKMENVLKSPADGTVAKVHAQKGSNVDKGAMLITFG